MDWQKFCNPNHWHEAANLFPLMTNEERDALAADIRAHGLQNPIVLFEGKVLDGRNRVLACKDANKKPQFVHWQRNGIGPSQYVVTQNLTRRQLSYDQRAGLALKLRPVLAKEAKQRRGGRPRTGEKPSAQMRAVSGKSSHLAAQHFGIGSRNLEDLIKLEKTHPSITQQLVEGKAKVKTLLSEWDTKGAKAKPRKTLAEKFGAPQFTIFDAKQGYWQNQKRAWELLGIAGEKGRGNHRSQPSSSVRTTENQPGTSVFDPALAELVCRWFCPQEGHILDPFAGESVKGLVAAKLGYDYTGIEVRAEQVEENRKQAERLGLKARWHCGTSAKMGDFVPNKKIFDLIFTSPPYWNLEEYEGGPEDLSSATTYAEFFERYKDICRQAIARLKMNRFFVVKVGDIRDKKTDFYCNFLGDNLSCLSELGLNLYNIAILSTPLGSAPGKAAKTFTHYRKLTSVHQYVLCFFKGDDPKRIPREFGKLGTGE